MSTTLDDSTAPLPSVDLWFPVGGARLPSDHGYFAYAALCRHLPALHGEEWWGLHTVRGLPTGDGYVQLPRGARLGLRLPAPRIPEVLPPAGSAVDIGGCRVRLGSPHVEPLLPAGELSARLVTLRGAEEAEAFAEGVRRQLASQGADGCEVEVGRRLVVRVAGRRIVGFTTRLTGVGREASVRIQERGVGGRRRFGCGLFRPSRAPVRGERGAGERVWAS